MGRFDAHADIIVKTTKCRPDVHTKMSREGVTRYPHDVTQQAAPVTSLLIWFRAVFSTTSVLTVLQEIMTETGI